MGGNKRIYEQNMDQEAAAERAAAEDERDATDHLLELRDSLTRQRDQAFNDRDAAAKEVMQLRERVAYLERAANSNAEVPATHTQVQMYEKKLDLARAALTYTRNSRDRWKETCKVMWSALESAEQINCPSNMEE
jgi:Mg2+ and Co2+ transporter CorA